MPEKGFEGVRGASKGRIPT